MADVDDDLVAWVSSRCNAVREPGNEITLAGYLDVRVAVPGQGTFPRPAFVRVAPFDMWRDSLLDKCKVWKHRISLPRWRRVERLRLRFGIGTLGSPPALQVRSANALLGLGGDSLKLNATHDSWAARMQQSVRVQSCRQVRETRVHLLERDKWIVVSQDQS
jgi:hypothetical protein